MHGSCAGNNVIPWKILISFCFVLYCMHNAENRHSEIILSTVNKIINEREYDRDFVVDLLMVDRAEDYKKITLQRWGIWRRCRIGMHQPFVF